MNMEEKYLYIIHQIFEKNTSHFGLGKKMFQKLFYLIEQKGVSLNLNYIIHFYGPYSAKLDALIHEFEAEDYLNINTSGMTHIINEASDFPKDITDVSDKDKRVIDEVLNGFISKTPRDLEALTTIDYVAKHISDDRKNETGIIHDVMRIKGDKFTESQLKTYYSQLKSASYINC